MNKSFIYSFKRQMNQDCINWGQRIGQYRIAKKLVQSFMYRFVNHVLKSCERERFTPLTKTCKSGTWTPFKQIISIQRSHHNICHVKSSHDWLQVNKEVSSPRSSLSSVRHLWNAPEHARSTKATPWDTQGTQTIRCLATGAKLNMTLQEVSGSELF